VIHFAIWPVAVTATDCNEQSMIGSLQSAHIDSARPTAALPG
jgi:hypothetical protein